MRTLATVLAQIEKLNVEAEGMRERERQGVLERIGTAIVAYRITLGELRALMPKANLQAFRKDDEPPATKKKVAKAKPVKRHRARTNKIFWTDEENEKVAKAMFRLFGPGPSWPDTLANRVKQAQKEALPEARRRVHIKGPSNLKAFIPVAERVLKEEPHQQPHLVNGA